MLYYLIDGQGIKQKNTFNIKKKIVTRELADNTKAIKCFKY